MHAVLMFLFLWFSPRGKVVPVEEIKRVVVQYINGTGPASPEEIVVEFRRIPKDIVASSEKYDLQVAADGPLALRGNVSLPLEIVSNGVVEKRFVVSTKIRRFGNVLFAARKLPQHSSIGDEDVCVHRTETTTLPSDIVTAASQLRGKRTTRIVSDGSALRESILEVVPIVKPEDRVNLVVRTKTVMISVTAVARECGRMGELVTVERPGFRGTFKGTVMNETTVELKLD
jgi:flagella basal body P-ring formation protein FlgA